MDEFKKKVDRVLAEDYRDKLDDSETEEFLTLEEMQQMNPATEEDYLYAAFSRDPDHKVEDEARALAYEAEEAKKEYEEEDSVDIDSLPWQARTEHRQDVRYAFWQQENARRKLEEYVASDEFQNASGYDVGSGHGRNH